MNTYTGLLFLHGHIVDPQPFADADGYAAPAYGNRVANARALRSPWGREDDAADPARDDADTPKAA